MALSTEGKIGIGLTLVFALGGGTVIVFPHAVWVGWATMILSGLGLIALTAHHFWPQKSAHYTDSSEAEMLRLRAAADKAAQMRMKEERTAIQNATPAQRTLEDYFKIDFGGMAAFLGHIILMTSDGRRANLPARIYFDAKSNAKFAAVYVSFLDAWALEVLPEHFLQGMDKLENQTGAMSAIAPAGDEYMHTPETVFSGRAYIYHQAPLTHSQIAALEARFKAAGVSSPTFRGFGYQQLENAKLR